MGLAGQLVAPASVSITSVPVNDGKPNGLDTRLPCRTEKWKPESGVTYKYLVIAPDTFPGEDIVIVMKPEYLADAEKENTGLVTYLLSEIDALIPHEHDIDFRKKVHMAKKTFGGTVRLLDHDPSNKIKPNGGLITR